MNSITGTNPRPTSLHLENNDVAKGKYENSLNIEAKRNSTQKTESQGLPKDNVSISAEAAEKQLKEKKTENVDASDNAKKTSIMELAEEIKQKTIDDIKNRIKELTEQLQALEAQGDEQSKEQAKLLQGQITDLNAQLLTIMASTMTPR